MSDGQSRLPPGGGGPAEGGSCGGGPAEKKSLSPASLHKKKVGHPLTFQNVNTHTCDFPSTLQKLLLIVTCIITFVIKFVIIITILITIFLTFFW